MKYKKRDIFNKIFVVCGSVRPGSLTKTAMDHLVRYLEKCGYTADIFHPAKMPVAYLGAPFGPEVVADLRDRIIASDGVIFCTPEYNGCFSAVTLAVLENLGYPSVLRGKPVSMLGVASGGIGAIKALEHLRGVCSHMGGLVLPWSVSISEVHHRFDDQKNCVDDKTNKLINSLADDMIAFLKQ